MKHRISKYAICPYYRHEDTQVIYCDGTAPDMVIHVAFCDRGAAYRYKQNFCRKKWRQCRVAVMLNEVNGDDV